MDAFSYAKVLLLIWCIQSLESNPLECNLNYCNRIHGLLRFRPAHLQEEVIRLLFTGRTLEQAIHSQCSTGTKVQNTIVHVYHVPHNLPEKCSVFALCSNDFCLLLHKESFLFSEDAFSHSNHSGPIFASYLDKFELGAALARKKSATYSVSDSYITHVSSRTVRDVFSVNNVNRTVFVNDMHTILNSYDPVCGLMDVTDKQNIIINVKEVPKIGCGYIKICNSTGCILYTHLSTHLAWYIDYTQGAVARRGTSYCAAEQIALPGRRRSKRRAIFSFDQAKRFLNFNLPGYLYCGPGTTISIQDDAGGLVNAVDAACRQHDLDYMLGVDPDLADSKLLQKLIEIGSPLYPVFAATFESKRYFERLTGHTYTTFLYFTTTNESTSLSQYFFFNSVYDNYNESSVQISIGREKEERWRRIVEEIWRGYCYSGRQVPLGENLQNTEVSNMEMHASQPGNVIDGSIPRSVETNQEIQSVQEATEIPMYNLPPGHFGGCRLLINEISTANSVNHFVELKKVCPTNNRNRAFKLNGYSVLVMEAGDPPRLLLNAPLGDNSLVQVAETIDGRLKNSYYFVLGSDGLLEKDMNILSTKHVTTNIPDGEQSTYAVVLTFTPKDTYGIPCLHENPTGTPYRLQEEDIALIGNAIQDIVVYGAPCSLDICDVFKKWTPGTVAMEDDDAFLPIDDQPDSNRAKTYMSISRCTRSLLPIQFSDWQTTEPTPKENNKCALPLVSYSYSLARSKLQSTAQKITVNLFDFFTYASQHPSILENNPTQLTSLASNINIRQVYRILARHRFESIATPGKKRKGTEYVLSRFDTMDLDLIKGIIQEEYRIGKPPFLDIIYNKAMEAFSNSLPNAGGIGRKGCRKKTFKKLLRKMGFRYGDIDMRLVILQRPDIVAWRGRYIKALRQNENGRNLPIVFTDESWIDVNLRSGKAWVPIASNLPYSERAKYSYARHKISRGPRLIILHAGTSEGFIHEVMKVYPVGGQSTLLDYHGNVDSNTYYTWFRSLLAAIKEKGPHIIVIDNAPYHTSTDAPKQSNKKADLLKWIRQKDPGGAVSGFREGTGYLKWELWEIVKKLKEKVQHYVVDQMAAAEGHTVLRLPPYNCDLNPIELVWKDVKDYVRKNNRDQTIESVRRVAEQRMLTYTPQEWEVHIAHTRRLAERYWREDGYYDNMMEQEDIIIPMNEDDDDDDDDIGDAIHSNVHDGEGLTIDNNGRIIYEEEESNHRPMDYSARRRIDFQEEETQEDAN